MTKNSCLRNMVVIATSLVAMTIVQAQVTPQAVIDNAPLLPTPEQWAANKGHTEAFNAKIVELNGQLNEIQAAMVFTVTQADYEQYQTEQRRQQAQVENQMQKAGVAMAAMKLTEDDIKKLAKMSENEQEAFMRERMKLLPQYQEMQKNMEVLASMGITEADFRKMENMNDKQSEVFIKKRLTENGYTEADVKRRMEQAGVSMISDDDWEEQQRRDREAQKQGEAMIKVQESQEAWMEQSKTTAQLMQRAGETLTAKSTAISDEYVPKIWRLSSEISSRFDQYIPQPEDLPLETIERLWEEANHEYCVKLYAVHAEFIRVCQDYLKALLPYAQAVDDAKKAQVDIAGSGNAVINQLQGMGSAAIDVAMQYLSITATEPEVKM